MQRKEYLKIQFLFFVVDSLNTKSCSVLMFKAFLLSISNTFLKIAQYISAPPSALLINNNNSASAHCKLISMFEHQYLQTSIKDAKVQLSVNVPYRSVKYVSVLSLRKYRFLQESFFTTLFNRLWIGTKTLL